MPPKVKVTKEEIVRAATALVRKYGEEALGARALAAELCCSTQPIFSNFASMQELRLAVAAEAEKLYLQFVEHETSSGLYPPYKASGMAYIRFASEEKELFKLLFMRNRAEESISDESKLAHLGISLAQSSTGLKEKEASLFHLEIWTFVHGIAVMIATGYLPLEWDLISAMTTDVYQGLKKRFDSKE